MPLLNKHSSGSDVPRQRGAIVVVSAWQRDSGQNTAMTARWERKESLLVVSAILGHNVTLWKKSGQPSYVLNFYRRNCNAHSNTGPKVSDRLHLN